MQFKYHLFPLKIQKLISDFLLTKTPREKYLLAITITLFLVFVIFRFIYMPLLENYHSLKTLYKHTQKEFTLSSDSLINAQSNHLEHIHSLQSQAHTLEENLTLIEQYIQEQSLDPNPFMLTSMLIDFTKDKQLNFSSFTPYPTLNALKIEGAGHFDDILILLEYIETHHFLSIDSLHFAPKENSQIFFDMLIINYHPNILGL